MYTHTNTTGLEWAALLSIATLFLITSASAHGPCQVQSTDSRKPDLDLDLSSCPANSNNGTKQQDSLPAPLLSDKDSFSDSHALILILGVFSGLIMVTLIVALVLLYVAYSSTRKAVQPLKSQIVKWNYKYDELFFAHENLQLDFADLTATYNDLMELELQNRMTFEQQAEAFTAEREFLYSKLVDSVVAQTEMARILNREKSDAETQTLTISCSCQELSENTCDKGEIESIPRSMVVDGNGDRLRDDSDSSVDEPLNPWIPDNVPRTLDSSEVEFDKGDACPISTGKLVSHATSSESTLSEDEIPAVKPVRRHKPRRRMLEETGDKGHRRSNQSSMVIDGNGDRLWDDSASLSAPTFPPRAKPRNSNRSRLGGKAKEFGGGGFSRFAADISPESSARQTAGPSLTTRRKAFGKAVRRILSSIVPCIPSRQVSRSSSKVKVSGSERFRPP